MEIFRNKIEIIHSYAQEKGLLLLWLGKIS